MPALYGVTARPDVGLTKCRVQGIRSRLHYRCEILKTLLDSRPLCSWRRVAGGGRQSEQLLRRMRCVLKDTAQREHNEQPRGTEKERESGRGARTDTLASF